MVKWRINTAWTLTLMPSSSASSITVHNSVPICHAQDWPQTYGIPDYQYWTFNDVNPHQPKLLICFWKLVNFQVMSQRAQYRGFRAGHQVELSARKSLRNEGSPPVIRIFAGTKVSKCTLAILPNFIEFQEVSRHTRYRL